MIATDSRGPTSIVRGASESGKRSYTTSPRGTNILHYLVGRIKPEHFMMQNICMATESTSSFYQNEPNKMQNKNVGKTAAAQLHFSAKIENCSSSPPFRRHPRILCLWRTQVLSSKTKCWRLLCAVSAVTLRGPSSRSCLAAAACCGETVIRNTQISTIMNCYFSQTQFPKVILNSEIRCSK